MKRLFVGNLSYQTRRFELKDYFQQFGRVVDVVVMESPTGQSKGFGYVEFETQEEARDALTHADNTLLAGRHIRVDMATERKDRDWRRRDRSAERGYDRHADGERDYDYRRVCPPREDYNRYDVDRAPDAYPPNRYRGETDMDRYRYNNPRGAPDDREFEPLERDRSSYSREGSWRDRYQRQDRYDERERERVELRRERVVWRQGDGESDTTVLVKNLPYDMEKEELMREFSKYRPVNARIATEGGKSRGYGFVSFSNVDDQRAAIREVDNQSVGGRYVTVLRATRSQEEAMR